MENIETWGHEIMGNIGTGNIGRMEKEESDGNIHCRDSEIKGRETSGLRNIGTAEQRDCGT